MSSRMRIFPLSLLGVFLYPWLTPSPATWALPSGGQVAGGAASIEQSAAKTTITQQSDRTLLNWQGFSIGSTETVQFLQPSATSLAVNRVLGGDPSLILGNLLANGRVFLLNPNGVVFGPGSVVNVGGLLATTLGLQNYDLEKGKFSLAQDPTKALSAVVNQGTLRIADHGFLTLTAPGVVNEGLIVAKFGQVGLHAGTQMTVDFRGDGLIQYAVEGKVLSQVTDPSGKPLTSAISNAGRIEADGGTVLLTAQASSAVLSSVINQTGIIQARRLEQQGGEIVLRGGDEGIVTVAGTLDATSAASEKGEKSETGEKGDKQAFGNGQWAMGGKNGDGERGGTITVTGDRVFLLGEAHADSAAGGRITVQGEKILQTGSLTADGTNGEGGNVSVIATSRIIQTAPSLISAQGGTNGTGGTIIVQAGDAGSVFTSGNLLATGLRGGTIHVLGGDLTLAAASADASGAIAGGTILIGGDYQGGGDIPHAATAHVNPATTLRADARESGLGGTIIVWSETQTEFYGSASTRGGALAGDGGLIEVSSKDALYFGGTADPGASAGSPGLLLLDPKFITISNAGSIPQFTFTDPNPSFNNAFGATIVPLSSGRVVITATGDDFGGSDAGAVYLFHGQTGALLASLTGSAGDGVGGGGVSGGGVTALTNGNYVVRSPNWSASRGAVTWGNGTTGVNGPVSAANSLVGSAGSDLVGGGTGGGVTELTNGNYVVVSPLWNNGAVGDAGAVTWGNGTTGVTGAVSAANSLVGSTASDQVGGGTGGGVTALTNGNYVVRSPLWNNGAVADVGAVTWGSGTAGVSGAITADPVTGNSVRGITANDQIGSGGVMALTNGHYVIISPLWDLDATHTNVGNVTWANGGFKVIGGIDANTGLRGSTTGDDVGSGGVTALTNGHYVVLSPNWDNPVGPVSNVGAVTWGNGTTGITGTISAANSLVGSTASDPIASGGVTALTNGNYVVRSPNWDNGAVFNVGAVTWGNGTTGITGTISAANSLVGSTGSDQVGGGTGGGVTALTNGNYVVRSPQWDNGAVGSAGAVTWGNGTTGITGTISAANSLVGSTASDQVGGGSIGGGVTALTNGHYVVLSPNWDNPVGPVSSVGAVTWGNGTTGITGTISAANSLVGSTAFDDLGGGTGGGVTALTNGHYVVRSPQWDNGAIAQAGAVTWGNGTTGTTGTVSTANSLVGSTFNDQVGADSSLGGVTALTNGHYVVRSPDWNNGAVSDAGAVTWGNGSTAGPRLIGSVSSANSLVGSTASDQIGSGGGVTALTNGHYVVKSFAWDNGAMANAGAVTWGNGTTGITGTISAANSLVGNAGESLGVGVLKADNVSGTYIATTSSSGGSAIRVLAGLQDPTLVPFAAGQGQTMTIATSFLANLLGSSTLVRLQASTDLTVTNAISSTGSGALSLEAGRSVLINANITTTNGAITVLANQPTANGTVDAQRDLGAATITMAVGTTLASGGAPITLRIDNGAGLTNSTSGNITLAGLNAGSGNVWIQNLGPTAGSGIVRADGTQLITANSAALDVNGAGGGGGIGTGVAPIRVTVNNLTARSQVGGLFLQSPTQGLNLGGAALGGLTGIATTNGGTIDINVAASAGLSASQTIATAGGGAISLTADALALNGAADSVQGSGTLLLQPQQATTAIGLGTGAGGTFNLTGTELLTLKDGFSGITIGRSDGQHAVSIQTTTFRDPVTIRTPMGGSIAVNGTLTGTGNAAITLDGAGATTTLNADIVTAGQPILISDSVLVAGGTGVTRTLDTTNSGGTPAGAAITVIGTINANTAVSNNESLTLTAGTAGPVALQGVIGGATPLKSLTVTNASTLSLPQMTMTGAFTQTAGTGTTTLNDAVSAGAVDLTTGGAGGIVVASTLAVTSGALSLTADTLTLNGAANSVQGSGGLTLQPFTPTTSIGLGDSASGTFNLTSTELATLKDGFTGITIGRVNGQHAIDVRAVTFTDPVTIQTPLGGSIAVNGTLTGTGTSITLIGSVVIAGGTNVTRTLDTTNSGGVAGGAGIAVTGTLNAPNNESLTLTAGTGGSIALQGVVGGSQPLKNLTVTNAANVTLPAATLTGILFQSAGTGTTTFQSALNTGSVNVTTAQIVVNGKITATNSGGSGIALTGATSLGHDLVTPGTPINLNGNVVVTGGAGVTRTLDTTTSGGVPAGAGITVTGTLNAQTAGPTNNESLNLTAGTTGNIVLQGVIGTTPLTNLTVTNAAAVTLPATTLTGTLLQSAGTGTTTLNGAVSAGSVDLTTSGVGGIVVASTLAATTGNLSLTAEALALNGATNSVQGSGALTVQPFQATTSIGLGNGAAGTFNLSNTELATLKNGFSGITIGRSAGQHTVDVRAATFTDPVTVRTPLGGSITVNGTPGVPGTGLTGTGDASITLIGSGATTMLTGDIVTAGQPILISDSVLVAGGLNVTRTLDTTNGGAVGAGAAITVTGTINANTAAPNNESLTLTAGTAGNVGLQGLIGSMTPLNHLTVTSAANTALPVTILTGTLTQTTGTGTTALNGFVSVGSVDVTTGGAGGISVASILAATTGNVSLTADALALNGAANSVQGGSALTLQPFTATTSIGLGTGAAGTFHLTNTELATLKDGFTSLTIGRSNGQHAIEIQSVTFNDPGTIQTPLGGSIAVNGALATTGTNALTLETGASMTVNPAGTLTMGTGQLTLTAGSIALNGAANSIQGSGAVVVQPQQPTTSMGLGDSAAGTFNLTTAELATLKNGFSSLTFGRSDGQHAITVNAVTFTDPVTIRTPQGGSITVNGTPGVPGTGLTGTGDASITLIGSGATTMLTGDIVTAGQPILISDSVLVAGGLGATRTLNTTGSEATAGANVTVTGTINANDVGPTDNQSLTVNAGTGGNIDLQTGIGGTKALKNLTITNAQTVGLPATTLTSALTQQSGTGTTTLNGVVTAGSVVLTTAGITLGGNVVATQAITLNSPTTLSGGTRTLDAGTGTITVASTLAAGGNGLVLRANGIDLTGGAGSISSSTSVTLEPSAAGTSIGVAGGAGTLQLTTTDLDALGVISGVTIGRSDGQHAITINAVTINDPVTIRTPSGGSIEVNGTITGTASVTLIGSGATTILNGDIVTAGQPLIISGSVLVAGGEGVTRHLNTTGNIDPQQATHPAGANITVTGTIQAQSPAPNNESLAINSGSAGTVSLQSAIGGNGQPLNDLTILKANDVPLPTTTVTDVLDIFSVGTTTLTGPVSTNVLALNSVNGIVVQSTVTGGPGTVNFRSDQISFQGGPGSVSGSGGVTLTSFDLGPSIGLAGGAGDLALSTTTLDALANGFSLMTIGEATINAFGNGGAITIGAAGYTFKDPVKIVAGTQGSGSVTVHGPLATTGSDGLTLEAGGQITVGATGTLSTGTGTLTLTADTLALTGAANSIQGTGALLLQPRLATSSIGLGDGAAGTFNLTSAEVGTLKDGFSSLTIGRSDGQHTITINAVTFRDPVTIQTPLAGSITVNGTLTGIDNASITLIGSGATTTLNADIVTAGDPIVIDDSVIVAGGAVTRNLNTTSGAPGGANVTVTGTIDAQTAATESLAVTAGTAGDTALGSGNGSFNQPIGGLQPLLNLTTDGRDVSFPETTLAKVLDATGEGFASFRGQVVVGSDGAITMDYPGGMALFKSMLSPKAELTAIGPMTIMDHLALDVGIGNVTIHDSINTQTFNFTMRGNGMDFLGGVGSVTGAGTNVLELAPGAAGTSLGLAGGAGTLQLTLTDLQALGTGGSNFATVKLGRADSTATVTLHTYTFPYPVLVQATGAGGSIQVTGAVATSTLGDSLTLQAGKSIGLSPGASATTNNGPLTLTANATGTATGPFVGIDVNGAMVSSGNGALSLTGTGGTSGADNYGVQLRGAAQLQTTAGAIQLDGTGGTGGTNRNVGAHLEGGSLVSSTSGLITITGHGGNGGGLFNRGVDLLGPGTMVTSTTGPIAIQGTGGANASFSYGVAMAQSQVRSGGDIHLTGQGGAGGLANVATLGMLITNGSQVEGLGNAAVALTGTGGSGTATSATNGEVGLFMHGQNGTFVRTASGDVAINGTGNGTGIGGQGVILRAGALVEATGSGNVLVHGIGSLTGSANSNGIQMIEAGTTVRSNTGNLTLLGTAHGALNSNNNIGLAIASGALVQKTGPGGMVTITGTGGDGGGGSNNFGVALLSAPTQILANNGAITITGTGTNGAAGVTAQGGFVVAPGIPCSPCTPSANLDAGAGGTITITSTP